MLDDTAPPDRSQKVPDDDPEWDFRHRQQVYLSGSGNFWLARYRDQPIGYVGAQDMGGAIELRRMYVQAAYRRHSVGKALVRELLSYSTRQGVAAIEWWTAATGGGMHLYRALGFRRVNAPGREFEDLLTRTRYTPGTDEIRMRLDLIA